MTDYAQLEMLKGNAVVNILKSTEIVSAFPKQVHVLKPITEISGLKGKKKGMKKRLTSGGGTRSFRKWFRKRARAAQGDTKLQEQILAKGEQAAAQFEGMLADMKGFAGTSRMRQTSSRRRSLPSFATSSRSQKRSWSKSSTAR